jgi:CHASE2 domain-containing sensor protein
VGLEWLAVGLLTSAVVLWLSLGGAAVRADNIIYDRFMRLAGGEPDDRILVVAIDNRSLEALGRWPWPRETHAALINRLDAAGASAVAYDVLFTEPAPGDETLAAALRAAGEVYLPMAVDPLAQGGRGNGMLLPVPLLEQAATGLGHVNLTLDSDGVLRRLPLHLRAETITAPHLMLPLLARGGTEPAAPGAGTANSVLLNWRGPPGSFRTVSFVDVVRGEAPPQMLAGKLVLVGMTADGQGDRYAAPTGGGLLYPGVEVQATLLDTLLSDRAVQPVSPWMASLLSLAVLWSLLAALLVLGPTRGLLATAGAGIGVAAASLIAFRLNVWAPPTAALAGLGLAYPLWSWRRLEAASAWFRAELKAFRAEGALHPAAGGGDVVQRQLEAMGWALTRLRDLGRFISDALRSLPDATVVVDDADRVLMANQRAMDLFGRTPLTGQSLSGLLDSVAPASNHAKGAEITTTAGRVLHAEDAQLIDASGAAVARIVRFADVTAVRQAQRQREEALQLLSHDMRAPQISTLTLLEKMPEGGDPEIARRVADNARLTLRLAEGYVQLARAESRVLAHEPLDLLQPLMDAADTLWPQANDRGVRIVLPSSGEEVLVAGDRGLMTRMFLNLLDNAIRFSPDGGEIECSLRGDERAWTCCVEDQGPGVPCDRRERIFRPFERVEGVDPPGAGLGLGLALVRAVVERHGGSVVCEDRDGGGARFVVRLPRLNP